MKALCFGSANIDHTYRVEHFTQPGETQSCLEYTLGCGGKGFNQAIAMALAGNETYFAGVIGTDGLILKETMEKKGVRTDFLKVENAHNGHAMIEVDAAGQNHIVLYGGTNRSITREYVDEVLKHFDSGDIVVLQNEISEMPYIIEQCSKKNMISVFNAAPYDSSLRAFPIDRITWLVVNETEGEGLSGVSDYDQIPKALHTMYNGINVLFTMGKEGSRAVTAEEDITVPAMKVQAVDTTAAGDTFIGYFVKGLADQMPLEDAMKLASGASAIAVTRPGAADSIPKFEEAAEFVSGR